MGVFEAARAAATSVLANKMRAALTVLGMTIGVASVIILVAVGKGSSEAVTSSIEGLGSNVLLVMSSSGGMVPGAAYSSSSLDVEDAEALGDEVLAPDVLSASPVVTVTGPSMVNGSVSYEPSQVVGTTPSYLAARGYEVAQGTGSPTGK